MNKIWFTSDWHLGHTNIAGPKVSSWKEGYRDFDSVHDMNKVITTTINKHVNVEDTIYFLGDFCFGGHIKTPSYRDQINCQTIHVLRGNHDHNIDRYRDKFASIEDTMSIEMNGHSDYGKTIFMSHYAHRVWEGSHKGVIHLYGHSHDSIPDFGKSMDVGIDVAYRMFGEYRPFSLEEIMEIMNKKKVEFPDHHSKTTNAR